MEVTPILGVRVAAPSVGVMAAGLEWEAVETAAVMTAVQRREGWGTAAVPSRIVHGLVCR